MKFQKNFQIVKDAYGEEVAITYIGCLAVNLTTKHKISDFEIDGSFSKRLLEKCIKMFWETKIETVHLAYRCLSAMHNYEAIESFKDSSSYNPKTIQQIMETTKSYQDVIDTILSELAKKNHGD